MSAGSAQLVLLSTYSGSECVDPWPEAVEHPLIKAGPHKSAASEFSRTLVSSTVPKKLCEPREENEVGYSKHQV